MSDDVWKLRLRYLARVETGRHSFPYFPADADAYLRERFFWTSNVGWYAFEKHSFGDICIYTALLGFCYVCHVFGL